MTAAWCSGPHLMKILMWTHQKAENKADLSIFRGSKYVQSKIGDVLIEVKTYLKQRRTVLFSGTPCQIAGLRMYLKKKYENLDYGGHNLPWCTVSCGMGCIQEDERNGQKGYDQGGQLPR